MRDINLVNALREHAEWAQAKEIDALRNEWLDTPWDGKP